ncbi:MAG: hypothetical protein JO068_23695 [Hyphomicrobiales bacterium]|nr:hypothetical protein [Hyphomicrobiales bacterium]
MNTDDDLRAAQKFAEKHQLSDAQLGLMLRPTKAERAAVESFCAAKLQILQWHRNEAAFRAKFEVRE